MRKHVWLSSLGIGALIAVGGVVSHPFASVAQQSATPTTQGSANATPIVGQPIISPTIDLAQAQQAALNGQIGAVVVSVDLNGENGVLVYDVELDNGYDVEIDATSGAVLKSEAESNDDGENDNGDANETNEQGDHQDDNGEAEDGD